MFISAADKSESNAVTLAGAARATGADEALLRHVASRIAPLRLLWHAVNDRLTALRYGVGTGRWLYRHGVVGWMYRPALRRQLPWALRLFATWAHLQKPLGIPRILAGEKMLKLAMKLHRASGGEAELLLDLGHRKVALNLLDPRMLQVPHELMHDDADVAALLAHLRPGDTFLDIGANHGSFAIAAAEVVGSDGFVLAVEPQPALAQRVSRSLEANARAPFRVEPIALGDRDGSIDLLIPRETSGRAGVFAAYSGEGAHDRVAVPLRRFDDAVKWRDFPGNFVMKLDIEGSEIPFLRGAAEMMHARRPVILLEINADSQRASGGSVEALRDLLISYGYTRFTPVGARQPRDLHTLTVSDGGNIIVN